MPLPHLHLLPGMHGTPELYKPFVEALGDTPYSTTHYANDPSATRESILATIAETVPNDRPYVLLAESFSGPFAATFAAEQPPNLVGLILVNTFLRLPLAPLTLAVTRAPWRMPWVLAKQLLLDRHADPRLVKLTRRTTGLSPQLIAARFRLLYQTDAREVAKQIKIPTLVLHGARDVFVLPHNSRNTERVIPGCVRKKLPGPHLLVQTWPEKSLEALDNWWQSKDQLSQPRSSTNG